MVGSGSMNVVLKNNRKLLRKRKGLHTIYSGSYSSEQPEYDLPKATPRQLNEIKLRIQSERRDRNVIIILVFGLVFSSVIVFLQTIL